MKNIQSRFSSVPRLATWISGISASLILVFPAFAQFQYASSIFSPPPSSIRRSADGTIAGELDAAMKYYGDYQTFAEAVQQTGLMETLRQKEASSPNAVKFTVFAPTEEAFAALPTSVREELFKPENREKLLKVLNYHIVAGTVSSEDVNTGVVKTVAGLPLKIELLSTGDRILLNHHSQVQSSQRAENGVIVLIDKVLLPPDL